MQKFLLITALTFLFSLCSAASVCAAQSWTLNSPSGNIAATINLSDSGNVTYSATLNGRSILAESPLGINAGANRDFRTGLAFSSESRRSIDETYPMISGKFSTYINKANELTLTFTATSNPVDFIFRAYDDGVAVRYYVPGSGTYTAAQTSCESTGIQLRPTDTITVQNASNSSYEGTYSTYSGYSGMTNTVGYYMPMLVKTSDGDYMLYTEADLHSTYAGSKLTNPSGTSGLMTINFSQTNSATVTLPFTSPWRVAVMGTLTNIAETMIIENLSPPCAISDTSWIDPGITSWAWLTRSSYPQNSKSTWIAMIDFAADIGWKYVLLDDGWQQDPTNNVYYPWFDDVCAYAKQKGIGLLVWSNVSNLNTDAKRTRMEDWAAKGIKGIKADFFSSENQTTLGYYDAIMKKAADLHLIVNCHGANKPTGERRTYPNMLAREGVPGAEQSTTTAQMDCTYPFTRNAVGPMDFTPLLDPWFSASNYTTAHGVGLALTIEDGIQCLADYPNAYLNSPARDYFQNMPCVWDETKFLEADLGNYVTVARRNGGTWYVGAINNGARTASIPLSFLGAGTYYAEIYREGAARTDIAVELRAVTKNDVITMTMGASGGGGMKITPTVPVGALQLLIDKSNQTLEDNASYIAQYVAVRAAAEKLKAAIADKEGLIAGGIDDIDSLNAAVNGLQAELDAFLASVGDATAIPLLPPWYNKYPNDTADMVKYNSPNSATIYGGAGEWYDPTLTARKDSQNLHLINIPNKSNITIEADLSFNPTANYQQAGLVFMRYGLDDTDRLSDDFNVNLAIKRYHSSFGNRVFMVQNRTGSGNAYEGPSPGVAAGAGPCKLRIVKTGDSFQSYCSEDGGATWSPIGTAQTNASLSADYSPTIRVGIFSHNSGAASIPATFENFKIDGVIQPFVSDFVKEVSNLSFVTPISVAPPLPETVPAVWTDGTKNMNVAWDAVSPDKYAAPGTYDVEGVIADIGRYVVAHVTVFGMSVDLVPGDNVADARFTVIAVGKPLDYTAMLARYDIDGKLIGVVPKTGSLPAAGNFTDVTLSIGQLRGETVKAFLWDAKTFAPLIANAAHAEPLNADKSALGAALDAAKAIAKGNYNALTWDRLQTAIASGQSVYDNADATRTMVDRETANVNAAANGLVSLLVKLNGLPGVTTYGTSGTYGNGNTYDKLFDGSTDTYYDAASNTAYNCAGINFGSGNTATLSYVMVYPRPDQLSRANNNTIRGGSSQPVLTDTNSVNGGALLATVSGVNSAKWYQFNSSDTATAFQYYWVAFASGSWGNLNEVEFWGTVSGSDLSLLKDRIAYADSLNASDYTSASWTAMQTALTAAKGLTASSAQTAVDTAAANLKNAINNLARA